MQFAWHPVALGAEYRARPPRSQELLTDRRRECQLDKSFSRSDEWGGGESLGALLQKRALSVEVDGEKKLSPRALFFLLLYKCPVTYGSGPPADRLHRRCHRCAAVGLPLGCLPVHMWQRSLARTYVGTKRVGPQACGPSLTCFLERPLTLLSLGHQNLFLSTAPSTLLPNSFSSGLLPSVHRNFLTLVVSWLQSSSSSASCLPACSLSRSVYIAGPHVNIELSLLICRGSLYSSQSTFLI